MSDTVIVGIFSLLGTFIGAGGGIIVSNKLMNYRIDMLEKKVDKHNNFIERLTCTEKTVAVLQEKCEATNHRIGDIEERLL